MIYTLYKETANLCLSELYIKVPPILIIFWQKDGKETKYYVRCTHFPLDLNSLTTLVKCVKYRCSKLLHKAESCYLQWTF